MQALTFTLSGKTAMFKKPDINQTTYLTFSHIHKPALLGLLGALTGKKGYNHCYQTKADFPEYYDAFNELKIAVVPIFEPKRFCFSTTIQKFTNTTGFASGEEGGVLIVKEQWLLNPKWKIFIQDDGSDAFKELVKALTLKETYFEPYLGKNDHPISISNVNLIELEKINDEWHSMHSLIKEEEVVDTKRNGRVMMNLYKEYLPTKLQPKTCAYVEEPFILTNQLIKTNQPCFTTESMNIIFY